MEKKIVDVNKKVPSVSGLVPATVLNTEISEAENKTPNTSSLETTTVHNKKIGEIKSKITGVSVLVWKTDYNANISDIEKTYFTSSDYNKFSIDTLDAKIKESKLFEKFNISNLLKKSELKSEQDKIVKLKTQVIFSVKNFLVMMVFKMHVFINQHLIQ